MTPRQIEQEFAKLANSLTRNVTRAVVETAREGVQIAKQDSSGRFSLRRLRQMGHSYARRAPNPPDDPAIINKQSGVFRAAWTVEPIHSTTGGATVGYVVNRSDRVRWLTERGTRLIMGRPIESRVRNRIEPVFQFNVEQAIVRSIQ
jgi:hypothetical protein